MQTMNKLQKKDPVIDRQESYLPPGFEINKLFYRLFPKIYYIGQENCVLNYTNYFMWVLESVLESVLITLFCIYIIGGNSVNETGISSDLWLVGITIFSAVICVVTFKLCTHTKFYSGIFIFCVFFLSLGLYLAYMWISNYYISTTILGTTLVAWTSAEPFLTVFFCICLILFVDGIVLHIDFTRSWYTSKMRQVIDEHI